MPYTTLREAGTCVRRREIFTGNNIYGRWYSDDSGDHRWYVVFSYGSHFPMYIWDVDTVMWYGNRDRYSSTTSRHQSACAPPHVDAWYDTDMMQKFATFGVVQVTKARMMNAPSVMGVVRDVAA